MDGGMDARRRKWTLVLIGDDAGEQNQPTFVSTIQPERGGNLLQTEGE